MIHHYLKNIVDGDISIRFLGDNPPLVVEYGVGADAGPAPDGDVIGPDERLHVVPLLQPGQNPVVQRPVVDRAVTGSHPEASLKQQGKNNLTRITGQQVSTKLPIIHKTGRYNESENPNSVLKSTHFLMLTDKFPRDNGILCAGRKLKPTDHIRVTYTEPESPSGAQVAPA